MAEVLRERNGFRPIVIKDADDKVGIIIEDCIDIISGFIRFCVIELVLLYLKKLLIYV
ncbi:MAG: hypothetical protein QME45_02445 [Clostridiales bacterium]|nr:hypothetical protein [Clostridiales bacterium]